MSSYVVSLPPVVSPGNYVIGDGGILVRVKEDDDGDGRVQTRQLVGNSQKKSCLENYLENSLH